MKMEAASEALMLCFPWLEPNSDETLDFSEQDTMNNLEDQVNSIP